MKNLTLVILAVAALITAYLWRQEGIATAKAEAEVASLLAEIATADSLLDIARSQYENDRSQFASDTLRLTNQLTSQRLTIARLRASGDSLESALAVDTSATSGDSIATFRRIMAIRLQEARTCGVSLDSTQTLFDGCTGLLGRADSLLDEERGIRRQTEVLAERYRRLSKPSIFQKVAKGLPWLGVGAGIVCLLKC